MRDALELHREPSGPLMLVVSGPSTDQARKAADQLRALYNASGKVVRLYADSREMPDQVPTCDVAIVVHHS